MSSFRGVCVCVCVCVYQSRDGGERGDIKVCTFSIKEWKICVAVPTVHGAFVFFQYELLICFHDDQDPAINLVQKLQDKYPKVDVRLFFRE